PTSTGQVPLLSDEVFTVPLFMRGTTFRRALLFLSTLDASRGRWCPGGQRTALPPRHRHHDLPRERRHAREGASDGGARLHPYHPALRSARRPVTPDEVVKINIRGRSQVGKR